MSKTKFINLKRLDITEFGCSHGARLMSYFFVFIFLTSCYSFTGGSKPDYLNTLYIASVTDNSGYGNPTYKDKMTNELINVFRDDNSFTLVNRGADAKLTVTISSIREEKSSVNAQELETERKIQVECVVEYYDAINKKSIWKESFKNSELYQIAASQAGRDNAINNSLAKTCEDILFKVISDW